MQIETAKRHDERPILAGLFVASIGIYLAQSLAWPFSIGRDGNSYLLYYLDFLSSDPIYHLLMVLRTPLAPLFFGSLLALGGHALLSAASCLLFAFAVIFIYQACRFSLSPRLSLAAALIVALNPSYGSIYHSVSSELPSAFVFAVWLWHSQVLLSRPQKRHFSINAFLVFALIMARPSFSVFLGFGAVSAFFWRQGLKGFIARSALFFAVGAALVTLFCAYNYARYEDFTIARTNKAQIPMLRAFVISKTVRRTNGPATAALADKVSQRLLNVEPYRSSRVTEKQFFESGSTRMFWDLLNISDREFGWNTDYEILGKAGQEAVKAAPKPYWEGVVKSAAWLFINNYQPPAPQKPTPPVTGARAPASMEGDVIPRSYLWFCASSPSGKMEPDPDSIELRILDPKYQQKMEDISARLAAMNKDLPASNGSVRMAALLNRISAWHPPVVLWLMVGFAGLALRMNVRSAGLAFASCMAAFILAYTVLGIPENPEMRAPFDPLFVVFGFLGACNILRRIHSGFFRSESRL